MKSLNPHEKYLQQYIRKMLQTNLVGYSNTKGQAATFDDVAWKYTKKNNQSFNLLFIDDTKTPQKIIFKKLKHDWRLDNDKRHLLMAYAIDTVAEQWGDSITTTRVRVARTFLSEQKTALATLDQTTLDETFKAWKAEKAKNLRNFIKWLQQHQFINRLIKVPSVIDNYDNYDTQDKITLKMPEQQVLIALGSIVYQVIPPDETLWPTCTLASQRNAFVCAMATLAMASPNRVRAEQTVLSNQKIQSETIADKTVFWLNWQGSKGYKDNQNHLLASMVEPLSRCLTYIRQLSEPARVLARFYENPRQSLRRILGEFKPEKVRLSKLGIDFQDHVHLFQLGYLLAFFEKEATFQVAQDTPDSVFVKHKTYSVKKIYQLSCFDRVLLSEESSLKLLGLKIKKADVRRMFGTEPLITVTQIQTKWIEFVLRDNPSFPFTYMHTNKVKFSEMMWAFTGFQLTKGSTHKGAVGRKSWFALTEVSALSNLFSNALGGASKQKSIFEEFGFSKVFSLTPHQFRHWLNTTAEKAGISHQMINLWSGRTSPEHILNYLHVSEGEFAHVIREINFNDEFDKETSIKSIKVYSQSEYEALTCLGDGVASATNVGFCVQNLLTSPCEYLNDFATQCTLCSSACHVKGDLDALGFLKKDYEYQLNRLDRVKLGKRGKLNEQWFRTHFSNTELLKELIDLMQDEAIEDGSVIRVLTSKSEIRITDLKRELVEKRKLALPCGRSALQYALGESSNKDESNFSDLIKLIPGI